MCAWLGSFERATLNSIRCSCRRIAGKAVQPDGMRIAAIRAVFPATARTTREIFECQFVAL
jgi:hypothetical protein